MSLPPCFKLTDDAANVLYRVRNGLTVDQADASLLIRTGLLYFVTGPTAGSGYALTEDGETAWKRYMDDVFASVIV